LSNFNAATQSPLIMAGLLEAPAFNARLMAFQSGSVVHPQADAAVVLLGNPVILWPALLALAIALRDWIVTRRADAFRILAFYVGPYLAWAAQARQLAFLYYYLPSATIASLALVYASRRGNHPPWLLWAFVAAGFVGFAAPLPISAALLGTSMQTFNRLMLFQSWI
jgi:dolichyl-phosphate-mannose-protein mannosyltransferase